VKENVVEVLIEQEEEVTTLLHVVEALAKTILLSMVSELLIY
jgi:hypothetical protein